MVKEVHDKSSDVIIISAKIESEINELDSLDEKQMFLDAEFRRIGSNKLIRASYKLLNLHSYFTAGEKKLEDEQLKVEIQLMMQQVKFILIFRRIYLL